MHQGTHLALSLGSWLESVDNEIMKTHGGNITVSGLIQATNFQSALRQVALWWMAWIMMDGRLWWITMDYDGWWIMIDDELWWIMIDYGLWKIMEYLGWWIMIDYDGFWWMMYSGGWWIMMDDGLWCMLDYDGWWIMMDDGYDGWPG